MNLPIWCAVVIVCVVSGLSFSTASAPYFSCNTGYQFQEKDGAARCYKAPSYSYQQPLPCGNVFISSVNQQVNHALRRNYVGTSDKCVGTFTANTVTKINVIDLVCPATYQLEVLSGEDRCRRLQSEDVKPPTRQVSR